MGKSKGVTLTKFVELMTQDIAKFEKDWKKGKKKHPDRYPDKMGIGDWYDQLLMFIGNQ